MMILLRKPKLKLNRFSTEQTDSYRFSKYHIVVDERDCYKEQYEKLKKLRK
jgi:hypothetical protein